ncbi:MAG: hypothetical protein H0V18_13890 [Pyrinomonadaceae bacterium]|nr:hypothetical protein [Pyrinomonadaceae bacterium]
MSKAPETAIIHGVRTFSLSMRWWLGLAFAVIAAATAVTVAQGMAKRSESAFRQEAEDRALEHK